MEGRQADDAGALVNCVMLVRWPERRVMIQQAIEGFARQIHRRKVLTVVNDGEPCALSGAFLAEHRGAVVDAPRGASIGAKRNLGARAVPAADYIAAFDDDDLSLPTRLATHLARIGDGVAHRVNRWLIAIGSLEDVAGFELASGYGASLLRTDVALAVGWPDKSWLEDHALFERLRADPETAPRLRESSELVYVHRRHGSNASAPHRKDMRQGLLPLQLAGADCTGALQLVRELSAAGKLRSFLTDREAAPPPGGAPAAEAEPRRAGAPSGGIAVGQRVRVQLQAGGLAARATVATLDAGHAEVFLEADGRELRVARGLVSALEPFEAEAESPAEPRLLKEQGNRLLALRDADAALDCYTRALKLLREPGAPLGPGSLVLVRPRAGSRGARLRAAVVATVEPGGGGKFLFDLVYEEDEAQGAADQGQEGGSADDDGDDDELVPRARLIPVGRDGAELQAQLYLNCARASGRRGDRLEPIAWAERALGCSLHLRDEQRKDELFQKALFLLARAELSRSNFRGAEAAAARGGRMAPADRDWAALAAEISRRRAEHKRTNRRLAKEVSRWLGGVMERPDPRAGDSAPSAGAAREPREPSEAPGAQRSFAPGALLVALLVLIAALLLARYQYHALRLTL